MPISGGGSGSGSGFTNRGSWSSAINYAINDVVTYNGSTYLCLVANSAVTPDSNATDWQIWAQKGTDGSNGTNGTNGTSTGNVLLSGGRAVWTSGYSFTVSTATYQINGTQYSAPQTNITLAAANSSNDRIDVIAANTSGAIVIVQGTAASVPAKPDIDPTTQIELTFVYVAAASTSPTISNTVVYDEGVEWTASVSGSGMVLNSTNSPFTGSKDIEATSVGNGTYAQFVNSSTFDIATKPNLSLNIKSKAAWPSSKVITLGWYSGSARVGNLVTIKDGTFGFNSGVTTNYQQIVVPTSLFGANGQQVDTLRATVVGSGSGIGFYLDDIVLQSGVSQSSQSTALQFKNAWSSSISYNVNDVVTLNGSAWVCTAQNINSQPTVSNAKWAVLSYPGLGWAKYLCAALEPDAIEALNTGTFSYVVSPSATKLLMGSWQTQLAGSGRMETRNPQRWLPMRGVTLSGTGSGSFAVTIDPTIGSYSDPWATYYSRLQTLAESQTRYQAVTAASQDNPFLPGPYGSIITQVTCFDFTWIVLYLRNRTYGINLWDEISDTSNQRIGDTQALPVSKDLAGTISSNTGAGGASGSVCFIQLPSTWSTVADQVSSSYLFRDDFMASSLNAQWTLVQSTAGNVALNTTYQWVKIVGNSSWGTNGLYAASNTFARSIQPTMVVDVYIRSDANSGGGVRAGFGNAGGVSDSNFAHAINFAASNIINVWEGTTNRGTVGSGFTNDTAYRVRIQALSGGGAKYYIQGGSQYARLGSASWTDITPGTSSSGINTLSPLMAAYSGTNYVSDFRVY